MEHEISLLSDDPHVLHVLQKEDNPALSAAVVGKGQKLLGRLLRVEVVNSFAKAERDISPRRGFKNFTHHRSVVLHIRVIFDDHGLATADKESGKSQQRNDCFVYIVHKHYFKNLILQ